MKKSISVLLFFLAVFGMAKAYDFSAVCSSGQTLYYNITGNNTVEITHQIQNYPYYTTFPTGALVIDSSVTYNSVTYSVTSIGNDAFDGCSGLTSVTIPVSVTSFGNYAFSGCTGLTRVNYAGDIESWCRISFSRPSSNPLFNAHHLYINNGEVTNLVIPDTITNIENYAFEGCSGLTSVTIPNTVISIGNYAFRRCQGLTSITIPNSVTSIGDCAFSVCSGLTSIAIGNSVTSIGNLAFDSCVNLTSITLPLLLTSLGSGVFMDCHGLTSITIPNSVTSLNSRAFFNCTGLTSIVLPLSLTIIDENVFENCTGLVSVTIPDSVTSIEYYAFAGCSGLTNLVVGKSVRIIDMCAFQNCNSLANITSKAETAPSLSMDAFFGVSRSIPVVIPCRSTPSYSSRWPFSNLSEVPVSILQCSANDSLMGSANIIAQHTCANPNAVIQATANSGYHFVQWNNGATANPYTLNITKDTSIVACFIPLVHDTIHDTTIVNNYIHDTVTIPCNMDYYTLTVTAWQQHGIAVGSGVFSDSTVVEIAAIPLQGFRFTAWVDGDTQNPRHVMVTGDATYTAVFDADPDGIDNAEACPYTITTDRENITVSGASNQRIRIFDAVGHLLSTENHPTERHSFRMPASGTYLVQIADRPAQKVVVIK